MAEKEDHARDLAARRCVPCEGGKPPLTAKQAAVLHEGLKQWEREAGKISKLFNFKGHYQTIAFVNAIAWISQRENHHPDLEVGYNHCRVTYTTHAIGGLSENDFICAAKIDALLD
jgi:4a-hydroxytetrahydrobiopterin dehydratase